MTRSKEAGRTDLPMLSVNLPHGVVVRGDGLDDRPAPSEELSNYLVVRPDRLVVNPLGKPHGSLGVASHTGIISPAYFVADIGAQAHPRFLHFLLRTRLYINEYERRGKWMPPTQFNIAWSQFKRIGVVLPPLRQQVDIASFLDRESGRVADLREVASKLATRALEPALAAAEREFEDYPRGRIGYRFSVQLGKKLYEDRVVHDTALPYLRNANVHWDRLKLDDLKVMNFDTYERHMYSLRPGDLLVCEGGEPGRCAVWNGEVANCHYQMALNRVRPFGHDSTRYLLWALRVLSGRQAFAVDGPGRYTHLTAAMLRAVRVPMPDAETQHERARAIDALSKRARAAESALQELESRLSEYRDALITEAVTGQLDIAAVSAAQMDERMLAAAES
ncbi:hypothetical protein OJ997_15530 [Solirubrobacter phytolaccae]|uniref:Type I restriction modification DNA specificity domain-containing protein n=1 Tax=Solirubrobacter phytolaccae TaxID=1404360 RepID=A0A9X3NBI6_9ACTN|nr:hypothetical protein [Solirubrobacter phytolaccae]MDA0181717.1 hypothetical protein [Solirubrobacter phytolaccae]